MTDSNGLVKTSDSESNCDTCINQAIYIQLDESRSESQKLAVKFIESSTKVSTYILI